MLPPGVFFGVGLGFGVVLCIGVTLFELDMPPGRDGRLGICIGVPCGVRPLAMPLGPLRP